MLYYYDIIGLIIFANTAKEYIFRMYAPHILVSDFMKKEKWKLRKKPVLW